MRKTRNTHTNTHTHTHTRRYVRHELCEHHVPEAQRRVGTGGTECGDDIVEVPLRMDALRHEHGRSLLTCRKRGERRERRERKEGKERRERGEREERPVEGG